MKVFSFNLQSQQPPKNTIFDRVARIVLFILGAAFIFAIITKGPDAVNGLLMPYITPTARIILLIFLLGIYPASFIHGLRRYLALPAYLLAYGLSGCAWLYALLFVISGLGLWGVLFCFLFNTLTPITIIGAIFKGSWDVVGNLALWLLFSFVIKLFAASLRINFEQPKQKSKIIDVEASSTSEE